MPQPDRAANRRRLSTALFALGLSSTSTALANSMPIQLFGPEALRPIGWMLIVIALFAFVLGIALGALSLFPTRLRTLDSNLAVFSRGVVSVMALSTLIGAGFCLLLGIVLALRSGVAQDLASVTLLFLAPTVSSLLFAAEFAYAGLLYRRVHRAKKDGLARVLSVGSLVLVGPFLLLSIVFCAFGASYLTGYLLHGDPGTGSMAWGAVGVIASAIAGVVGFALAMSGKIESTTSVLGRGGAMLFAIALFFVSAFVFLSGLDEWALRAGGAAAFSNPLSGVGLFAVLGTSLLLLSVEFGLGAALHWQGAKKRGSVVQRLFGNLSVGISAVAALGALVMLGFGALVPFST